MSETTTYSNLDFGVPSLSGILNTLTGIASSVKGIGTDFIASAEGAFAQSDTVQRVVAANLTSTQFVDTTFAGDNLADVRSFLKSEDATDLASALQQAAVNDKTFIPGMKDFIESSTGTGSTESLLKTLQNPEFRADLTIGLQNLAAQDDITFANLSELIGAATEYDATNMQASDRRVVAAYTGMGLPAEAAHKAISDGKMSEFKEFMHDLFHNPDEAGGKLGNMLEGLGLPEGITQAIAGFLPQFANLISQIPEFLGNMFEGSGWDKVGGHIGAAVEGAQREGLENMVKVSAPTATFN